MTLQPLLITQSKGVFIMSLRECIESLIIGLVLSSPLIIQFFIKG